MELLEHYYNQHIEIEHFHPRKCHLPSANKINLFGVRGGGKTTLVVDYLSQIASDKESIPQHLYIDLDDPKLFFQPLKRELLQRYIEQKNITLLILDHFQEGMLCDFPKVQSIIVVSRIPISNEAFEPVALSTLDYEEFLAFEQTSKHNGLNHFLRLGTLPQLAHSPKSHIQTMKHFFTNAFTPSEQKLMLLLAQHHTQHLTTHQIYHFAKEKFKISKDWLYKSIKRFKEEKVLFFINERYQTTGKKMVLFDFSLAKYLTLSQPFITQFDAMVALTLLKHPFETQTLGNYGYITKENHLFISAPFESEERMWVKSQKRFSLYKQHGVTRVTLVTVANHYDFTIEKLSFEALPFDEWSITLLELS